jgi:hypothetical protein
MSPTDLLEWRSFTGQWLKPRTGFAHLGSNTSRDECITKTDNSESKSHLMVTQSSRLQYRTEMAFERSWHGYRHSCISVMIE